MKLLEDEGVRYLLLGGYAVAHYGHPRGTADLDVWVAIDADNARKLVSTLRKFGMDVPELTPDLFLEEGSIVRMGIPPVRIEVINRASGVEFAECFDRRRRVDFDGVEVNMIDLGDLRANKQAAGRVKDLDDLRHLPEA